jgi:hypothetical protein
MFDVALHNDRLSMQRYNALWSEAHAVSTQPDLLLLFALFSSPPD